jgi:hypothetical protein
MKKMTNAYNILVENYKGENVIWEIKIGWKRNNKTELADWFTVKQESVNSVMNLRVP